MKRITAIMSENVQNVGYRARVVEIAKKSGITGSVQNLTDGRVKIIAEGDERDLESFLDAISIKNALINVENVEVKYSDATREYNDFYKLVGEGETDERLDKASEYLKELIVVVKGGFGEMKEELGGMREEVRTGFGEMKEEMGGMREEMGGMREEMGGMREEMRTGFETLSSKQDQTIEEIKLMRGDLKSYMDWKLERIKSELEEKFAPEFDEIKSALRAHGLIDVSN
jgi:acylphosphatase